MRRLLRPFALSSLLLAIPLVAIGVDDTVPSSAGPVLAPPDFDDPLPRRSTSRVHQFVGPAAIKVSGREGSYRWNRMRFGSREVELRVGLVGLGGPCRLNLRLVEGGDSNTDLWFQSASAAKEEHEATIGVEYADARLKIDTDCSAWSVRLRPIEDAELGYTITERYYRVRGDDLAGLRAATQRIDGEWAAYTEWVVEWTYATEQTGSECLISDGQTWIRASITYPRWDQPADVDQRLARQWEAFVDALRVHELGHVTIALQGAAAIDDRLDRGVLAPTCGSARVEADAAAQAILDRYNQRSTRYDDETSHGATQRAALE